MKQWIVGKVNSGNDVAEVKGDLFSLCKEIVRITIQRQLANTLHWNKFFRNYLGWIEQIEVKLVFVFLFDDLNSKLPFRIITILNRFPQIATMEVRIFA